MNFRQRLLSACCIITASGPAHAAVEGWRYHWEQGQNEWGWGDWGTPAGTGFFVSCPDQPDNGDRVVQARIRGDLSDARLTFSNHSAYNLPLQDDAFGRLWADLRASTAVTITSGGKRVVVPTAGARKVMSDKVCGTLP